ncbi:Selenocysteine insertion sequence-binding protein 2-like [Folsomia candida]|uniref:Selenocysteine insertion sequence-binding protein 2-like n=1 Tax=Folsomia candida TaxID=158441 RepID=A0A226DFK7_FOLCA|nr:Selenocysteine insertion sequence-binding protein 2-like [Folsomia candida]
MECYQCVETPGDQGHLSCEVERGDYNLDDLFHENADVFEKILENGDDEDDDITKFIRKAISALPKNPYVNSRYLELKEAISTIQFQKRESSSWLTVEVQLRNQDDTFSFILPDFDQDLVSIPGNSIFYTAL